MSRVKCPPDCKCRRHTTGADLRRKPRVCLSCERCGNDFRVIPSRGVLGPRLAKYCSQPCANAAKMARRRASGKIIPTIDMTTEEFRSRLVEQGGRCAICSRIINGREVKRDHCHKTGKWRGLLCNNCNLGLGNFQDDPNLLMVAAFYLAKGVNLLATQS